MAQAVNYTQMQTILERIAATIAREVTAREAGDAAAVAAIASSMTKYRLVATEGGVKLQQAIGSGAYEDIAGSTVQFADDYVIKSVSLDVAHAADQEANPPVEASPAIAATAELEGDAKIVAGDTYIDFVINNGDGDDASHLYLNVKSLAQVYTGGDGITVTNGVIAAKISATGVLAVNQDGELEVPFAQSAVGQTPATGGAISGTDKQKLDDLSWATDQQITTALDQYFPIYYTVTVDGVANSVASGTSFTATATVEAGYEFDCWKDENSTVVSEDNPYTFTVTGDVTITSVVNPI